MVLVAWATRTPKRIANIALTGSLVALMTAAVLQTAREQFIAAAVTGVLSLIPLVSGPLILADWRGMTSAWSDSFYPSLGFPIPEGRWERPLRRFQHASTRLWGLIILFLAAVLEVYAIVFAVRDLT
jgi:hypothetical protein